MLRDDRMAGLSLVHYLAVAGFANIVAVCCGLARLRRQIAAEREES